MEGSIMKRLILAGIGLALAGSILIAQSRSPEVAFTAAQHKEEVERDFTGAIEDYKKIVEGKDHAIAAKALLRIADIYEKQHNAQAEKTYEEVAARFPEQKEVVAQARTHLAALREGKDQNRTVMIRELRPPEMLNVNSSRVSRDGHYMITTGRSKAVLRDLETGSDSAVDGMLP